MHGAGRRVASDELKKPDKGLDEGAGYPQSIEHMFDTLQGSSKEGSSAVPEAPERVVTPQVRSAQIDDAIRELSALVAATEAKILHLVAERDALGLDLGGWSSPAAWLSATAGYSPSIARSQVEVAGRLSELPDIKAAFSSGEVSFSEVKEIVPIATPETEEVLLNIARHAPVATTQRFARVYSRARRESSEDLAAKRFSRRVSSRYTDDGMYLLNAQMMRDEGALLDRVLDKFFDDLRAERAEGIDDNSRSDHQVTRADALVEMAMAALEHGLPEGSPANPVVMHVDIETLAGLEGEVANLDRKIGIPIETIERYMCDCAVKAVLDRDGDPLHVGRKYRSINRSMRIALEARDECCQWPGCVRTRALQAHHLWMWIEGGLTDIEDLRLYCRMHHMLLHEGGFKVVLEADGSLTHLRPNGALVYEPPRGLPRSVSIEKVACDQGVNGGTRAQLEGAKLDHHYAAGVVADRDPLWNRRAAVDEASVKNAVTPNSRAIQTPTSSPARSQTRTNRSHDQHRLAHTIGPGP